MSLSQCIHSALLFCPVSYVSTLTLVFYQSTLPCDLSRTDSDIASVWDLHHRTLTLHTRKEFQCTTDSIGLHLFSYSLQCLHLQLLVNLVPPLRCDLNSLTPLLCQVYLGPGLNPSQKSVRETQTTPLCFTYNLSLTPSLPLFSFPSRGSKPNHWRSLICERGLHHQETINKTSNCHIAGISPGLGLCLNILCVTVHASSQNQNVLVLSGSLTLEQCFSELCPSDRDTQSKLVRYSKGHLKMAYSLLNQTSEDLTLSRDKAMCELCVWLLFWLDGPVISVRHKPGLMHAHSDSPPSSNMTAMLFFFRQATWSLSTWCV